MRESVRIRRNYIFSLLSISSRLIANVVVFWIIARYYGPESYGVFTFVHTLATTFILFADFGFDVLLTNELARDRSNAAQLFQRYFSYKLIFTIASLIVMWAIALLSNFSPQIRVLIFLFSAYMVFTTQTNFLFALYKGLEKLEYETKVSLFINVGLLFLITLFIILKVNVLTISLGFVFTRVAGFVIGIKYSFKVLPSIKFRLNFSASKEIINKVFIFGFHFLFSYLFFQLDTILLAIWKGEFSVGIYQAVFKLIMLPLAIPEVFVNTLLPVLSRFNVENKLQWKRLGLLMSKLLLIVIIPISIILFVYADQVIEIIYGVKFYSQAIPILRVFAVILFIRFTIEPYALMLTTSNRQRIRLITVICATIINFVLNYFMIPAYGVLGASVVSLITNLFVASMFYIATLPLFIEWFFNIKTIILLSLSFCLAYLFWLIRDISIFLASPILFSIFIVIAYFYFFSDEDKKLLFTNEFKLSTLKSLFQKEKQL